MLESVESRVVLLDEQLRPSGTHPKNTVHTHKTPLHMGFSCHLVDPDGNVLVTRRALTKKTWPGVWTNSFCGHPQPQEELESAVKRHAQHELNLHLELAEIRVVLPTFRYRAVDASGIVENELCPVFTATLSEVTYRKDSPMEFQPNSQEVMDYAWAKPGELARSLSSTPWAFSPWFVEQASQLALYAAEENPTPPDASESGHPGP